MQECRSQRTNHSNSRSSVNAERVAPSKHHLAKALVPQPRRSQLNESRSSGLTSRGMSSRRSKPGVECTLEVAYALRAAEQHREQACRRSRRSRLASTTPLRSRRDVGRSTVGRIQGSTDPNSHRRSIVMSLAKESRRRRNRAWYGLSQSSSTFNVSPEGGASRSVRSP